MTTGESATPNFDFEAIVQRSGIVDPGVSESLANIRAYERSINANGGKASMGYEPLLRRINEDWPQHNVTATISGRVYVFGNIIDEDTFDNATAEWGEPIRTDDSLYWNVADTKLISMGIVDNGEDVNVEFTCAFGFDEDPVPSFVTRFGESSVSYDRMTPQAAEMYLFREWPEIIESIEQQLPDDSFDVAEMLNVANRITEQFQNELLAHDGLREVVAGYLTKRAQFSGSAAYALILEGPLEYIDKDEIYTPLHIPAKTLQYTYRPVFAFRDVGGEISWVLVATVGDGPHDDELIAVPKATIKEFRSTYDGFGLLDRIGKVDEFRTGNAPVELDVETISVRHHRLEEFRNVQMTVASMIDIARDISSETYDTEDEALERAESALPSIWNVANSVDFSEYDLRVEGEKVIVPPLTHEFSTEDGSTLSIKPVGRLGYLHPADFQHGHCEDIVASYHIDEASDGSKVYRPTVSLQLQLGSTSEGIGIAQGVVVAEASVMTFANVPLDCSVVVIDRLDAEEVVEAALLDLDASGEGEMVDLLESVYAEVLNGDNREMPSETIKILHRLAEHSMRNATEKTRKLITVTLDAIFNGMSLALNTGEDSNDLVEGAIVGVNFEHETAIDGTVVILSAYDESLHTVAVTSLKTIVFERDG